MQAWHQFWRTSTKDCICTAHTSLCYLSVLLYVQHLLPHHHCYYSEAVVRRCAIKKGVLINFGKFTGKHLWRSLFFNKVVGIRPATLFKKRLWHKCFPMSFAKFLRTPFVTEDFWWLVQTTVNICLFLVQIQKASKSLNLASHFHWSHFHRCYFLFPSFFCLSQVLFHFFLSLLIKRILLSWEFVKMFLLTLTSLKYVHLSK